MKHTLIIATIQNSTILWAIMALMSVAHSATLPTNISGTWKSELKKDFWIQFPDHSRKKYSSNISSISTWVIVNDSFLIFGKDKNGKISSTGRYKANGKFKVIFNGGGFEQGRWKFDGTTLVTNGIHTNFAYSSEVGKVAVRSKTKSVVTIGQAAMQINDSLKEIKPTFGIRESFRYRGYAVKISEISPSDFK
jgi:hypothetical protein